MFTKPSDVEVWPLFDGHLAFECANRNELDCGKDRLDELGMLNGGVVDAPYGSGLSFRDPDSIALEFVAPPTYAIPGIP